MSSKGGMSAVPLFPQNMLAVKEENPRQFWGQICYLVWWFILLCLFIVYAAFNLKDYLEAQDNPVITTRIQRAEKLNYPVFLVCPFGAMTFDTADLDEFYGNPYYKFGLQVDPEDFRKENLGYSLIDTAGGARAIKQRSDNSKKDKKDEGVDFVKFQPTYQGLNLANTGSLYPAKRDPCTIKNIADAFVTKSKDEREKENELQNKIAQNYQFVVFRSLAPIFQTPPSERTDEDVPAQPHEAYYPCVVFNSDRKLTREDQDYFLDLNEDGLATLDCEIPKELNKSPLKGARNSGNKLSKSDDSGEKIERHGVTIEIDELPRAYATDVGYYDGYVMVLYTNWVYDRLPEQFVDTDGKKKWKVSGLPNEFTVTALSLNIQDSLNRYEPTSAEYTSINVPVGTTSALYLTKLKFQCVDCDEDQISIFYNTTVDLLDISSYPQTPCYDTCTAQDDRVAQVHLEFCACQAKLVRTEIHAFYNSMTWVQQEEIITQGVLDYLGNFAGMLGTLLAFDVLTSVDRLISYAFIGNGANPSVWDD